MIEVALTDPRGRTRTLRFERCAITIGSDENADIVLRARNASSQHARLAIEEGLLVVQDLGSIDGTHLNGCPVKRCVVSPDDVIRLGGHALRAQRTDLPRLLDPTERALLEAIRETPDDDGPRRVYADWLAERGDPRGELIALQCELARLGETARRRREIARRVHALLDRHWSRWREPLADLPRSVLCRGFVEPPLCPHTAALRDAPRLLRLSPALYELGPSIETFGAAWKVHRAVVHGAMGPAGRVAIHRAAAGVADQPVGPNRDGPPLHRALVTKLLCLGQAVDHPSVIRPLGSCRLARDKQGVVYPWIDGPSARELVEGGGPVPGQVALAIGRQLCDGLAALHRARAPDGEPLGITWGFLGRDQVRLVADGRAVMLGLGAARSAHPAIDDRVAEIATTVRFPHAFFECMSPELVQGHEIDPRSDLFSLGTLLLTLLAGRHPFCGQTDYQTLRAVQRARPPSATIDALPNPVAAVVTRLLQVDPDRRYPDAVTLGRDLDRVCAELGWQATPETVTRFLARWKRGTHR